MRKLLPDYFPEQIESKLDIINLKKNDCLFHVGDSVESLFYILKGGVKAVRYHFDGTESIMLSAGQKEFFAESGIATQKYVCDAVASRDSEIVKIPIDEIRELLASDNNFILAFTMSLAKMLRKQCSKYERLRLNKAKDRVYHYLTCESDENKRVNISSTIGDWAGEMGLEPETLYRTLKELESDNVITRNKKNISLNL